LFGITRTSQNVSIFFLGSSIRWFDREAVHLEEIRRNARQSSCASAAICSAISILRSLAMLQDC
jgi:hypothetical protein